MIKRKIFKVICIALAISGMYQAWAQCPDVYYAPSSTRPPLVRRGWDTLVTCDNPSITLYATPYVTCSQFQGYRVTSIPYDPPDTTFCSHAGGGGLLPVNQDDYYDANVMQFPFTFVFWGRRYNGAVVGPNGNVSFDTTMAGSFMPYNVSQYAPIPSSSTQNTATVKNNIFGLWEDIDPRYFSNTGIANAGIHKAIYTLPPAHHGPECRMLLVSYKGVPKFGHSSAAEAPTHYSTSQIVCYEGTNIIDVHIKRHSAQCGTDGNKCVVGIINPTGDSAVCAPGRNPLDNTDITTPEAWRFEPYGTTVRNIMWYRNDTSAANLITDNVTNHINNDTLYKTAFDTLGQYLGLVVAPTVPTTYVMRMKYIGANGALYDVCYPVKVGVNKQHNMRVSYDPIVCKGEADTIRIYLDSTDLTQTRHNVWTCDNNRLRFTFSPDSTIIYMTANQAMLFLPPRDTMHSITTNFSLTTTFTNGCTDSARVSITHVNRIDDTIYGSICDGESYVFGSHEYTQVGTYSYDTLTVEGCPYTHTLRLDAHSTSASTDYQKDCHPYTWIDSVTYYETTNTPTYTTQNRWGCDSVVTLNFTFDNSLQALIEANPLSATLDNLHLQLRDVSIGSNARTWYLPDGRTDTNVTVYYEFPTSEDSISFMLVARSEYKCEDTAYITIPLLKETIWFPNAFTPNKDENNLFKPEGIGIVDIHVDIFDRRGILVNSFDGVDAGWDGTSAQGVAMPEGAYVYVCRHTNVINPGNPEIHKGTVLLLR